MVRRLAVIVSVVPVVFLTAAAVASAARPGTATPGAFKNSVTFIGDSVTAGFGYCGTEDSSKVKCKPNDEIANSWFDTVRFGTSLRACRPLEAPQKLIDTCSNDNYGGEPWEAPAWSPGPNAPTVAYPFQLAAGQSSVGAATVSDWAVTGSTPAEWDPTVNSFGRLLGRLNDQYVVMTLGANPLLSAFTDIKVDEISVAYGACVSSTGYQESWFGEWYAGPLSKPLGCLEEEWKEQNSAQHLARIYSRLLAQGDRVIVLGYYRGCPWSFGNWQVEGTIEGGPAKGKDCKSQTRPTGPKPEENQRISQWEQAVAVSSRLNLLISNTVKAAKVKAKIKTKRRRGSAALASNIVFALPNLTEWESHQPGSPSGSWIFLNDTWIHPSKAGHANLAQTVASAMCLNYGHWCGSNWQW